MGESLTKKMASMSIKELKHLAADRSVDLYHCVEKSDMVDALMGKLSRAQANSVAQGWARDSGRNSMQHTMDAGFAAASGISEGRMPCSVCGRRFALDRYARV